MQGVDSGHQFPHAERLGHVIISAEIQTNDFVHLLAFGGKHEDGSGDFPGAQLLAHVVAAQAGQHDVEHDERRLAFHHRFDGLVAAGTNVHFVTFPLEDFLQTQANVRVVFNDQDFAFHKCSSEPLVMLAGQGTRPLARAHLSGPSGRVSLIPTGKRSVKQLPPPGRGS